MSAPFQPLLKQASLAVSSPFCTRSITHYDKLLLCYGEAGYVIYLPTVNLHPVLLYIKKRVL